MLQLHSQLSPEKNYFDDEYPQNIVLKYVYGTYPIPTQIVRLTALIAGLKCLSEQIGGTYKDLSTFSVPHFSGSIGQAYVNIREAVIQVKAEIDTLIPRVATYFTVV